MIQKRASSYWIVTSAVGLILVFLVSFCAASTEQTLFVFRNGNGEAPYSRLISDASGNLYGTTSAGGIYERGTVFELKRIKNGWKPLLLYSFGLDDTDGFYPYAGLVLDTKGNLYGTTVAGGANDLGTVFQLKPVGDEQWTEMIIYSFAGGSDGNGPYGDLVFDNKGDLYGTTAVGGANTCSVAGRQRCWPEPR
jgi:uncharacterized repeat protein (TIGR03803 family)